MTRILTERYGGYAVFPKAPLRVPRNKFDARFIEFERALALLVPQTEAVLVVLDSDDADPQVLADELTQRAAKHVSHRLVLVAPDVREFEAWFLASLDEMSGKPGVVETAASPEAPESIRDAKGRFRHELSSRTYSETVDQKKYVSIIDLDAAERRSPSFARLVELVGRIAALDGA